MKGLIIKPNWADLILDGQKTWEIRGSKTNVRGEIDIIKSGTGKRYGTVELVGWIELTKTELRHNTALHQIPSITLIPYKKNLRMGTAKPQKV